MTIRFLCSLSFHHWHYRLSEVGYVPLRGWPTGTKCMYCGIPHPDPLPVPELEGQGNG